MRNKFVRGQVAALNHQRQGGHGYHNGPQSQSRNQNSLTHADLWLWLVDHGVPRREINKKPTKFLRSRKVPSQVYRSLTWIIKQRITSFNQSPDLNQFIDPELLERKGGQVPLKKNPSMLPKIYTVNLSSSLLQRDWWPFIKVNAHWK